MEYEIIAVKIIQIVIEIVFMFYLMLVIHLYYGYRHAEPKALTTLTIALSSIITIGLGLLNLIYIYIIYFDPHHTTLSVSIGGKSTPGMIALTIFYSAWIIIAILAVCLEVRWNLSEALKYILSWRYFLPSLCLYYMLSLILATWLLPVSWYEKVVDPLVGQEYLQPRYNYLYLIVVSLGLIPLFMLSKKIKDFTSILLNPRLFIFVKRLIVAILIQSIVGLVGMYMASLTEYNIYPIMNTFFLATIVYIAFLYAKTLISEKLSYVYEVPTQISPATRATVKISIGKIEINNFEKVLIEYDPKEPYEQLISSILKQEIFANRVVVLPVTSRLRSWIHKLGRLHLSVILMARLPSSEIPHVISMTNLPLLSYSILENVKRYREQPQILVIEDITQLVLASGVLTVFKFIQHIYENLPEKTLVITLINHKVHEESELALFESIHNRIIKIEKEKPILVR